MNEFVEETENTTDMPISILDLTDPKSLSINVPLIGDIINLSKVTFLIDNSTEININFIRKNFLEEEKENE